MTGTEKLNTVRDALDYNEDIRRWYAEQHGLIASMLTVESVVTYGTGGHGDLADQILSDVVNSGDLQE